MVEVYAELPAIPEYFTEKAESSFAHRIRGCMAGRLN